MTPLLYSLSLLPSYRTCVLIFSLLRKNVTKGYSDAQIKVRKATSNEAWGPEGQDMAEIAQMTFDRYVFVLGRPWTDR